MLDQRRQLTFAWTIKKKPAKGTSEVIRDVRCDFRGLPVVSVIGAVRTDPALHGVRLHPGRDEDSNVGRIHQMFATSISCSGQVWTGDMLLLLMHFTLKLRSAHLLTFLRLLDVLEGLPSGLSRLCLATPPTTGGLYTTPPAPMPPHRHALSLSVAGLGSRLCRLEGP